MTRFLRFSKFIKGLLFDFVSLISVYSMDVFFYICCFGFLVNSSLMAFLY